MYMSESYKVVENSSTIFTWVELIPSENSSMIVN